MVAAASRVGTLDIWQLLFMVAEIDDGGVCVTVSRGELLGYDHCIITQSVGQAAGTP